MIQDAWFEYSHEFRHLSNSKTLHSVYNIMRHDLTSLEMLLEPQSLHLLSRQMDWLHSRRFYLSQQEKHIAKFLLWNSSITTKLNDRNMFFMLQINLPGMAVARCWLANAVSSWMTSHFVLAKVKPRSTFFHFFSQKLFCGKQSKTQEHQLNRPCCGIVLLFVKSRMNFKSHLLMPVVFFDISFKTQALKTQEVPTSSLTI